MPFLSTVFLMPALHFGKILVKFLDQGWVEYLGGQGVRKSLGMYGSKIDFFTFLNLKNYLLVSFILIVFFILLFYLGSLKRAWL